MRKFLVCTAAIAAVATVFACSSKTNPTPATDAGAHSSPYPTCQLILDKCHELDVGEGDIHDCHETAHDATSDAPCQAAKAKCDTVCVEKPDSGGGDSGGDAKKD